MSTPTKAKKEEKKKQAPKPFDKKAAAKKAYFVSMPPQTVIPGELRRFVPVVQALSGHIDYMHMTYDRATNTWTNNPKLHLVELKGKKWIESRPRIMREQIALDSSKTGYVDPSYWTCIANLGDTFLVIATQIHLTYANVYASSVFTGDGAITMSKSALPDNAVERWVILLYNEKHYYMPENYLLKVSEVVTETPL